MEIGVTARGATLGLLLALFSAPVAVLGGEPVVESVEARLDHAGRASFDVTLRHADEGWDHYADRWDVLDGDGHLLGQRVLLHPHVNEQPFTRSLRGVAIPAGVEVVYIRPHDSVHGDGAIFGPVSITK